MEQIGKTGFKFRAARQMVPHDAAGSPELEPLFANHVELISNNSDFFIDFGVIPPAEMIKAVLQSNAGTSEMPEPVFYVLQRVAMSMETFRTMRDKINEMWTNLEALNGSSKPTT